MTVELAVSVLCALSSICKFRKVDQSIFRSQDCWPRCVFLSLTPDCSGSQSLQEAESGLLWRLEHRIGWMALERPDIMLPWANWDHAWVTQWLTRQLCHAWQCPSSCCMLQQCRIVTVQHSCGIWELRCHAFGLHASRSISPLSLVRTSSSGLSHTMVPFRLHCGSYYPTSCWISVHCELSPF